MNAPSGISAFRRAAIIPDLENQQFDILVIGGGIMGAGIALEATARGLKVLLVEKQDFAAGTSSRSTKLIHGGLRYLKNLEFGLVASVARERRVLHRNAPHLVLPEPMLLPVRTENAFGYWATAAGLTLYDLLGKVPRAERHHMLDRKATLLQEPLLKPDGLKGSGLFSEYRTDDARLTISVLKTAASLGATCLNYVSVKDFIYEEGQICGAEIQDELTQKHYRVNATCLINAAGPWAGKLLQNDQQAGAPVLYHTKGVHLVVPYSRLPLRQSVYFDIPGGRMLFAIPRNEITYLGTTDTPFTNDLTNPVTSQADATYLLEQINKMFPEINLQLADVESSWAGVRTLLFEEGKNPSEISRKDEIFISGSGLITVAGGKLTGYRPLAETVVKKALKLKFPNQKYPASGTRNLTISGGNFRSDNDVAAFIQSCQVEAQKAKLPAEKISGLVRRYGSFTREILLRAPEFLNENPDPESALLQAEIWYTIHFESALTISDFLIRRTGKLYFERPTLIAILPIVKAAFRNFLQLSEEVLHQQETEFLQKYEAALAFLKEPELIT